MNTIGKLILGVMLLSGVATIGYWLGGQKTTVMEQRTDIGQQGKLKPDAQKILYYRNPMGLPDTSPVPKKDSMGMDYVAVYKNDVETSGSTAINISVDKIQKLGVKSETVQLRMLNKSLRVTGRIEIDERHTYTIAPKFEGWVEHLYVNSTGQSVSKGQTLFDVYSPELVSAQREHALAVQGLVALKDADDEVKQSMQQLAEASRMRLKNWDVAGTQSISSNNGERARVSFSAPVSGIVLEKKAVQGMRFMPGEMLYQIADLSSVWVIADVPEQDMAHVQRGNLAQVTVDAYPERTFNGKVDFIYPTLNNATRTVQARIEISNPKGLLKPAMFANAQLAVGKNDKVLAVPTSAVINTGTRQVVLVRLAEGRFEPRTISLGNRSNEYIEVLAGVSEGEEIVTTANFLIDAESNLKAALNGMNGSNTTPLPTSLNQHEAH